MKFASSKMQPAGLIAALLGAVLVLEMVSGIIWLFGQPEGLLAAVPLSATALMVTLCLILLVLGLNSYNRFAMWSAVVFMPIVWGLDCAYVPRNWLIGPSVAQEVLGFAVAIGLIVFYAMALAHRPKASVRR